MFDRIASGEKEMKIEDLIKLVVDCHESNGFYSKSEFKLICANLKAKFKARVYFKEF